MLSKNGFHPSRNITDEIYVSSIILCHPLLCENGFHWGLSYTIYLFIFPFLPFKKPKKYKSTMLLLFISYIFVQKYPHRTIVKVASNFSKTLLFAYVIL